MQHLTEKPATQGTTLRWRIVVALLVVSLVPLCLMGVGAWIVFGSLLEDKALELQRSVVASHAASIESHLATQRDLLQLAADTHNRDQLTGDSELRSLLTFLNHASNDSFVDLGIIAEDGSHLAYAGPYNLTDRNYHDAEWFAEVMSNGVFISDVFLGFRQVPHFVIAIKKSGEAGQWVLRATVNSDKFDQFVQTGLLGKSAEAFVLNRDGLFQTAPKTGSVLDHSPLPSLTAHTGMRDQRVVIDGKEKTLVTSWINGGRWLLVVHQDASEVRAPVTRAMTIGALLGLLAALLVVVTTIAATRHLSRQIDHANQQREEILRAFMRSAKLASVGELATGLAHEINNPLAIISAEQTNIADLLEMIVANDETRDEIAESAIRIKAQVGRCAAITTKMLQFGRQQETSLKSTELKPSLQESVEMMRRQADLRSVEIKVEIEPGLPNVFIDPIELEQVMVNLITNAFHAMPQGGTILIAACLADQHVCLEIIDSGHGMSREIVERIFEPFFTTKEAGKGTGLGLSVCYGILHSWGGEIAAESQPGHGTTIRMRLPLAHEERRQTT